MHPDQACSQSTKISPVQSSKLQASVGRHVYFEEDNSFVKSQSRVQMISLL